MASLWRRRSLVKSGIAYLVMTNTLPFSMVSLPTSHGQSQFFVGKSSNIFQLNFCHGFQWLPTREIPGVGRSTLVIARQAVRRSRTLDPFFLSATEWVFRALLKIFRAFGTGMRCNIVLIWDYHHFHGWYGYHSQSWVVYGIVLTTLSGISLGKLGHSSVHRKIFGK